MFFPLIQCFDSLLNVPSFYEVSVFTFNIYRPGPYLQLGARGITPPRQKFCRQITKFASSVGKFFLICYILGSSEEGATESSLICFIHS